MSSVIWIQISATGELAFRHRQGHRIDTWQHVTSLDHFGGAKIPLYNSKKKLSIPRNENDQSCVTPWIDSVVNHKLKHLDVECHVKR